MHAFGDNRVFMSGPLPFTQFLDTNGTRAWTPFSDRPSQTLQDYAPSVFYDDGKILYVGGGIAPLADAAILDLSAPDELTYGQTFTVATSIPGQVGQVNWVRLSSVTHSFNTNQRISFLKFTDRTTGLSVTATASANVCLPAHTVRSTASTASRRSPRRPTPTIARRRFASSPRCYRST